MNTSKRCPFSILLTFAIVFLVPWNSFAQEQFRLSDYKNPEYRWQQLDLKLQLGGNNNLTKTEVDNGENEKDKYSQFHNRLDANYYATKNSASYQGYQNISFATSMGSTKSDFKDFDDASRDYSKKQRMGSIGLRAETVNRFYNDKKMFLEADLDFKGSYMLERMENTAEEETLPYNYKGKDYGMYVRAGVPLYIGIGRIEQVQDARLAVYILEDLKNSGDLKRQASNEEIMAFSEFITKTKNQRFFDSRLRKIAEITAIDTFLYAAGLKSESDASYYTILNDDWDYANGPVRSAGGRFSIGILPSVDFELNESENLIRDTINYPGVIESYSDINKTKLKALGMDFVSGYIWEKPANLYWQHTFNADVTYSLYYQTIVLKHYNFDTLTTENETNTESPNLTLKAGYQAGYYPNSRTQIILNVNSSFVQNWVNNITNDELELDFGYSKVANAVQLSCYYYISPQLRFTLNLSSIYTFTLRDEKVPEDDAQDRQTHDIQSYLGASLTYSIF